MRPATGWRQPPSGNTSPFSVSRASAFGFGFGFGFAFGFGLCLWLWLCLWFWLWLWLWPLLLAMALVMAMALAMALATALAFGFSYGFGFGLGFRFFGAATYLVVLRPLVLSLTGLFIHSLTLVSLVGAATSIIFVAYFCRDKNDTCGSPRQ